MVAPTGNPDPDILSRLEAVLDDSPIPPAIPEDTQEIKDPPRIEAPPLGEEEEPPPIAAEGEEPEVVAEAVEGEEAEADDGINTVSDLAKMFEVEESVLLDNLQVDAGDGNQIPLSSVLKTYREAPEATRNYQELQAERVAFQQEAAQLRVKTDEQVRDLAVNAQVLLDVTNEEFKDVDWKRLEIEEPSQYLIMKERQRERSQMISRAIETLRGVEQDRATQSSAEIQQNRSAEIAKLHTKMPTWKDAQVAQAAMNETQVFLSENGFSADEINNISDHRYLLVAYEASQFRKLKNQAPQKLENLRSLPKPKAVLRSTARRDTSGDAQKKMQRNMDRLKQTGSEEDAARVLEELL